SMVAGAAAKPGRPRAVLLGGPDVLGAVG
ncbi:MAG: hypothetical protein ACI8QC_002674, partial [Planctomycetota bacterium]